MFQSPANSTFIGFCTYLVLVFSPILLKALGLWFVATSWWWVTLLLWGPWLVCFLVFVGLMLRLLFRARPALQTKDSE